MSIMFNEICINFYIFKHFREDHMEKKIFRKNGSKTHSFPKQKASGVGK